MGTVIELSTKKSVTVKEDLDTVLKCLMESSFCLFVKRFSKGTIAINRDAVVSVSEKE